MKKALIVWMAVIGILLFCGTALADSWICDNCGTENTGNFCANCGAKKPDAPPEAVTIPQSDNWGCPDCYHLNSMNFCVNCGRTKPSPEEMARSIAVPEPVYDTMDVEGVFVGETLVIPEEDPVIWEGSISDSNKEDHYTFTAPRDGRYGFTFENIMANASLHLEILDSTGERVLSNYSNECYLVMTEGETYSIKVEQSSGSTQYTLRVGIQKPTRDISSVTTVYDQVSFADQKNVYMFTAPISGRYRFDLTETNANTTFHIMMWDKYEKEILSDYSGGAYVVLDAGETYQLQVRYYNKLGSYVMRVYFQKETRDITGYGTVNDSIEYDDQKNVYTFTPPVTGRYRFDLTESSVNTTYHLMMWDKYDKELLSDYSGGAYAILDAGETYQLQVRYYNGHDAYKMLIGYQKEPIDITGADAVYDRITFDDQKNVYYFKPSQTGDYELTVSNIDSSCTLKLMAWDKRGDEILTSYNGQGTLSLEANETYEIQVRQYNGYDSYRFSIRLR